MGFMISHFLVHSVKSGWLSSPWYRRIFLLFFFASFSLSCPPQPQDSQPKPAERSAGPAQRLGEQEKQRQIIRQITDQILLSLATHNYSLLEPYLADEQKSLRGTEAARILLGPRAYSFLLDRWDAQQIEVLFDQPMLWATAKVEVWYRRSANRKSDRFLFTFRFNRANQKSGWRLYLP